MPSIDNQTDTTVGPEVDVDEVTDEERALYDAGSFDDEDESDTDEAAKEQVTEEAEPADTDTDDEAEPDDTTDETSEEESDDEAAEDAVPELTPEQQAEAERKQHNDEMAKLRIAEAKARKEAETVRKAAEESNIERYLKDAEDDDALLRERQAEVREYRHNEERIALNSEKLQISVDRAVASIDLFSKGTPAVQNRMYRALDQFEAMNIVKDERGRPTEIRGDLYQFLAQEAAAIAQEQEELRAELLGSQKKAKNQQRSRTTATPTRSPNKGKAKVDADLAAFDEEANA